MRLRLSQTELEDLAAGNRISEATTFAPDQILVYSLERAAAQATPAAFYNGHEIMVILPDELALAWTGSDDVSIIAEQDNGSAEQLSILIEKDFRCLSERPNEDETDLFPHPKEGQMKC